MNAITDTARTQLSITLNSSLEYKICSLPACPCSKQVKKDLFFWIFTFFCFHILRIHLHIGLPNICPYYGLQTGAGGSSANWEERMCRKMKKFWPTIKIQYFRIRVNVRIPSAITTKILNYFYCLKNIRGRFLRKIRFRISSYSQIIRNSNHGQ